MKNKILTIIFIMSIITPFLCNVLVRKLDFAILTLPLIFLISLVALVLSLVKIKKRESNKKFITYIAIGTSCILIFLLTYRKQIELYEYISYQKHKVELKNIVEKINDSNITTMTDRYENLNGYPIKNWGINEFPLDSILFIYKIDKQEYENLRIMLKSVGYKSVSKLDNGIIFFVKGGIIDNCHGIAYSSTETPPIENNFGRIIKWRKIVNNWYVWVST